MLRVSYPLGISHNKSNTVADMMVIFSAQRLEVRPLI